MSITPDVSLTVGSLHSGFIIRRVTGIPALRGTAYEMEHLVSGARALHLQVDDSENLFSISIPTPPPDNTGLPHILEHAVLAGSRQFPVREPFFEMLKASLATFINAMTGPDCTYYPVASSVKQDLFNLAQVYFDAVFHPLLTEETFQREGHHLAPADRQSPSGPLTVSGIVYNEMKGVYSDPESRLFYTWIRQLLPDTAYALNYAGDPEAIPGLTYERFRQFHAAHYHPSNARIYLYGDIPTREHLVFLDDRLRDFTRSAGAPPLARQPRWTTPRTCVEPYAVNPAEPLTGKTYLMLNWMVGNSLDPEQAVLRHVLSRILLGNEAAPLKKALIDSKLGQDILSGGDMDLGQEAVFAVGLKGSETDRAGAFESLVLGTLQQAAGHDLDRERIEAAFRQVSYHYREILPQFPLHTLDRVISPWIHGADPLLFLDMGRHLEACRLRYAAEPDLFNRLIREELLDNPHRLMTVLKPDPQWQLRTEAAFAQRMEAERAQRTDGELKQIALQASRVEEEAGTPNSPEAVALLPHLNVRDLPARPRSIPTVVTQVADRIAFLRNDLFTNGVNYLQLNFNLSGLPDELWAVLPRYRDAIAKLGAAGLNYEQMARRVSASTGGISCSPVFLRHAVETGRPVWSLRFTCKALEDQVEAALGVLRDLVFAVDPRDRNRLHDVLTQARAGYRSSVMEDGHLFAQWHAGRRLTAEGRLDEQCHGIPQLALTADWCKEFSTEAEPLMNRIERLRDFILEPGRLAVSFTGSDRAADQVQSTIRQWAKAMPGSRSLPGGAGNGATSTEPLPLPGSTGGAPREGLAVPIQVAHCAQAMAAPRLGHPDSAALAIGAHLVRFEYLLSEIRLKGNAYGAAMSYNPLAGTLFLTSFRDPHITRTLDIFAGTPQFARAAPWTQADVDRAIIGVAKQDERPLRPGEATGEALTRHLTGMSTEVRNRYHAARLEVTPVAARQALLSVLEAGLATGPVCVVADRGKLEEANTTAKAGQIEITDVVM
jgi:Zn-dependent M16 (insulinase) family peptidase